MSVAIFPPPTPRSCVCGSARCGSAGRASGAPAGSPAFCGANCNSTASGPIACQEAAKGRAGPTCCKCWRRIASFHPAASGGCIANGSSIAPWPICSAPTSASRKRISSTPVTTSCIAHKQALFSHLTQRWRDLFNASFDVLLMTQTRRALPYWLSIFSR